MKKILAIIIAMLMITACAAEAPEMQNPDAEGASSEQSGYSEENKETGSSSEAGQSSEQSSHQSESSEKSEEPKTNGSEESQSGYSEESKAYSETSSAPETISRNPIVSPFVPGNSGSVKNAQPIENTFVKRADARVPGGEELIKNFAVNAKYAGNGDKLLLKFNSVKAVRDFVEKAENVFQLGEGEGSLKEKLLSYDEGYFLRNTLLVAYLPTSSGSIRYEVAGYVVSGTEFHLCIKTKVPEVGTADMADFFAVAECSFEQLGDCMQFMVDVSF